MRKRKENMAAADELANAPDPESLATEREERFDAIDGETSTDGVGPGYSTDPGFEKSVQSADGPLSGESFTPPTRLAGRLKKHGRRKKKTHVNAQTRHAAANSPRKL